MTRYQSIMKQIAKLASEAAGLSTGEEHQAAVNIKYAADTAMELSDSDATRNTQPATRPHHD